jgi:hypothetical protein
MNRFTKKPCDKTPSPEKGQILIWTLLFLVLGILLIIPLLSFMSTGSKTSRVYEQKTERLYAADSGIEDAKWLIKNDHLDLLNDPVTYMVTGNERYYDYSTQWTYQLPEEVNDKDVVVTIQNEWIPKFNYNDYAVSVNEMATQEKLLVIGKAQGTVFTINISYIWGNETERDNLR